jgi:soluble lytic murein transglycosylase-like protein
VALALIIGGGSAAVAAPDEEDVLAVVSVLEEPLSAPELPVPALIADAARRWGVDETALLRIAWCESRWDPAARGPAGLAGLFQFAPLTWDWVSVQAGYAGASPYDARANAEAAAWLYRREGPKHWGCK